MINAIAILWVVTGLSLVAAFLLFPSQIGKQVRSVGGIAKVFLWLGCTVTSIGSVLWIIGSVHILQIPVHILGSVLLALWWWVVLFRSFNSWRAAG